jgi:hypothetical protein
MSIGARCRITKIFQSTFGYDYFADAKSASHYEMIKLDCPNGEYEFLMDILAMRECVALVGANFIRCPREVAFETLGL